MKVQIAMILIGSGLVETALVEFLQENIEVLTQEEDFDLKIIGKQVPNKRIGLGRN